MPLRDVFNDHPTLLQSTFVYKTLSYPHLIGFVSVIDKLCMVGLVHAESLNLYPYLHRKVYNVATLATQNISVLLSGSVGPDISKATIESGNQSDWVGVIMTLFAPP